MIKKMNLVLISIFVAVFLSVGVYAASEFVDVNITGELVTNVNFGLNNISNITNVSSVYVDGNSTWVHQAYPAACPGTSAITRLGDSVTCQDLWLDAAGDNFTGNLNGTLWNVSAYFFKGIYNWAIGSSSGSYLTFNGTHLGFNGTYNNETIDSRVVISNSSMKDYVDTLNSTMQGYVVIVDTASNTSLKVYIDTLNGTMNTYVTTVDTASNTSLKTYVDTLNSSMHDWVIAVELWNTSTEIISVQLFNTTADIRKSQLFNTSDDMFNACDNSTWQRGSELWNDTDDVRSVQLFNDTNDFIDLLATNRTGGNVSFSNFIGGGTGNPISPLHIESTVSAFDDTDEPENYHLLLRNPTNANYNGTGIAFLTSTVTDDVGAAIIYNRTASSALGELLFYTKQNENADGEISKILTLTHNGRAGVGIRPLSTFHVNSTSATIATFERWATTTSAIEFKNQESSLYIGMSATENFAIGPNVDLDNSPWFYIDNVTGNIGMGTKSTVQNLTVNGTANITENLTVGGGIGQSGITMYDEAHNARCMMCFSDGVCNSTSGACG